MIKQDLEVELEKAKKEIKEWESNNLDTKQKFSEILGFYQEKSVFDEGIILDWYTIFFEIGKLMQRANTDRSFIDLSEEVKRLVVCKYERKKDECEHINHKTATKN